MIILSNIKGKIIVYQIKNENLNLSEIDIESKIRERNKRLEQGNNIINTSIKDLNNNEIVNKSPLPKGNINNQYYNIKELEKKFTIFETEKNGDCLFESLGKAENISSVEMRDILMDYLEKNYKNLEGFEQDMILNNENIETYINKMKKRYEYGTFTEISVYSLFYKKRVTIYMIEENGDGKGCFTIGNENQEITNLLYISNSNDFEAVNHYKLLMKK